MLQIGIFEFCFGIDKGWINRYNVSIKMKSGVFMYSLVVAAIVCATINNFFLHLLSNKVRRYNPYLFNGAITLVWVVCLLIYNGGFGISTRETAIFGCLYGLTLTGFIFFKSMAMATGSLALTALIGCGSFVVTTIFNAVYWHEQIGAFEIIGIILMLIAVLMINRSSNTDTEKKDNGSFRWKLYCAMFFIFSAATGIIFRFHQTADKAHTDEMMIFSAIVATLMLCLIAAIRAVMAKKDEGTCRQSEKADKKAKLILCAIAVASGIFSCVYNRLNIYNSGVLPSTFFFPVFNGGVVIGSLLVGIFFFKEKPSKIQLLGVCLGCLAIVTLSRFFGLF